MIFCLLGDYILVGTNHPVIRLYDVETFQCFVGNQAADQHKNSINCIAYSPSGHVYASGSKDGAIKVSHFCLGVLIYCVLTLTLFFHLGSLVGLFLIYCSSFAPIQNRNTVIGDNFCSMTPHDRFI